MDVNEAVTVAVGVKVNVGVELEVTLGRGVLVAEAVNVGRGVLVEVRVQTMGVRVNVAVAESAAMNDCIRSVLAADVARTRRSTVGVNVGAGVFVMGSGVGEEIACVAVSVGDGVSEAVGVDVTATNVANVATGV